MAAKQKVLKQVKQAILIRDQTTSPGNTTLTAAAAKGATALQVAAITNFSVGDTIRVGQGEDMERCTIVAPLTGTTINVANGLDHAHVSGDVVIEQAAYDLGDIVDGSGEFSVTGDSVDVPVSTQRLSLAIMNGFADMTAKLTLPGFSLYNFAHALGMLLAEVTGAQTQASPRQIVSDGTEIAGDINMCLVLVGLAMDNTPVVAELWGVDMDYTGLSLKLSRGAVAGVPLAAAGCGGVLTTVLPDYTILTTLRPTKSDLWDALTEVGYFLDTGTSSTISGTPAADATTITLASAAGFASGDWIKINSGSSVEYHWIDSIATNTLTLRTRLLRAQVNGAVVKKVTPTPMAGCSEDGVSLDFGGSLDKIRFATRKFTAGLRPGAAQLSIGWGLTELSLFNFASAMGIPQSEIANSRLPIGDKVGTSQIEGMYARGTTKGGGNVWLNAWGNDMDVSSLPTSFNNRGTLPTVQLKGKPSSGFQMLSY